TVGTTGDDCGRIGGRPNPSTDAPICPQVRHHGSPHARERSDLRERAQSTQSTTPITATAFRSLLREKKIKTGGGRSWGQPPERVVKSTKSRGGRGDGGPRDGLTWTPAPGPRSGRSTRRADRPEGAAGHCPARTRPGPSRPRLGRRKDARMKIRVERDGLADAVAWVARSLPSRPPVPVLGGVLLDAGSDGDTD